MTTELPVGTKINFVARKRHPFYDPRTQECVMLYSPLELAYDGMSGEVIGIPRDGHYLRIVNFGQGRELCLGVHELEEMAA